MIILPVGFPASGKTTWAKKQKAPIISPDDWRYTNGRYAFDPSREPYIWRHALARLGNTAQSNDTIIFDAINTRRVGRQAVLTVAKQKAQKVHAIVICTPWQVCVKRNAKRKDSKRVPDEAMERMRKEFVWPSYDEGFVRITTVGNVDAFIDSLSEQVNNGI